MIYMARHTAQKYHVNISPVKADGQTDGLTKCMKNYQCRASLWNKTNKGHWRWPGGSFLL